MEDQPTRSPSPEPTPTANQPSPETPQFPTSKPKSKGKIIGKVFIAIVVIALAGGVAYLFMQNQDQSKKIDDLKADLTSAQNKLKAAEENATKDDESDAADNSTQYFAIEEWGIKFALPDGLKASDITYTINDNTITFNTKTRAALNQNCSESSIGWSRGTNSTREFAGGTQTSDVKVGDYYYFGPSGPQSTCADEADLTVENAQNQLLIKLIAKPVAE
ncbi:hypothetical protein FWG95_00975 [Candidatus Saccharibacteria bacterium]|nr:hypothetical protein [Candidatus Saccharibacteria bacterium]